MLDISIRRHDKVDEQRVELQCKDEAHGTIGLFAACL